MTVKRITVSVEDDLHAMIDRVADLREESISSLTRQALVHYCRAWLKTPKGRKAARAAVDKIRGQADALLELVDEEE